MAELFEDCELCVDRLRESLADLDGMLSVRINSDHRTIEVRYDKDLLTFEEIREHARLLGVTVAERFSHRSVSITGLDCPDCAVKLERSIRKIKGVAWASVNYATSVLIFEFEPRQVGVEGIEGRVRDFGYDIEEPSIAPRVRKARIFRETRLALTVISGILLAAGIAAHFAGAGPAFTGPIFIASAVLGGIFAARSGILSLRAMTLDTNFLMTAAAAGAICLGDYIEAAAVMFLFSLGSTLESYTVERTRTSIKSLVNSFPTSASVLRNGHVDITRLEDVEIGELVLIKPGERIPVDGAVVRGESSVNEAPITGEPAPKYKSTSDLVYAGSINGNGSLEVRTTTNAADNTLARIVHMVEEAQAQKAPSQRLTETFGRYYTRPLLPWPSLLRVSGLLSWAEHSETGCSGRSRCWWCPARALW